MFGKLFKRAPVVIKPWSERSGFKGSHRSPIAGKHRTPRKRGSGMLVPGRRLTPLNDRGRFFLGGR